MFKSKLSKILTILGLISLISVAYIAFRAKPSKPVVPTAPIQPLEPLSPNFKNTQVELIQIDPQLIIPSILPQLPVYTNIAGQTDILTTGAQIAKSLKLTKSGPLPYIWTNSDETSTLVANPTTKTISYSIDGYKIPSAYGGSIPPTLTEAQKSAEDFVHTVPSWSAFSLDSSKTQYLSDLHANAIPVSKNWNFILFQFHQLINGVPLSPSSQNINPITVTVGQKNQVIKFDSFPIPLLPSPSSTSYPTLSKEEVLQALVNKHISLIDISTDQIVPQKTFPSVKINSAYLEYRSTSDLKLIIPFLHFIGVSPNNSQLHFVLQLVKIH